MTHFMSKADRIYQVNVVTSYDGSQTRYATTSTPLADAVQSDIPAVEAVGRLFGRQATLQVVDGDSTGSADKKYREDNFFFADPAILNIFSFDFLKGNPETALSNPNQIILAERIAIKYFGSIDDAVGKQLLFEGSIPLEVSAVIEDFPDQSSNRIELLAHFENYYTSRNSGGSRFPETRLVV